MGSISTKPIETQLSTMNQSHTLYSQYLQDQIRLNKIIIFSQSSCYYCLKAKELFNKLDIEYKSIELDVSNQCPESNCKELTKVLIKTTGMQTVPQIFIDGKLIGGFDKLSSMHQNGQLKNLLK
jgi:glutaredoxin 3